MQIVGLTGGIASGKSTFAAELRARGVPVIDADALARAAVARGSPALAAIATAFGPEVIGPEGELDRPAMAARVFGDAAARARLEAIVHPRVRELFAAEVQRLRDEGHPFVVYDVPLLYEKHLEGEVDLAVVVWAPRAVQHDRLMRRDRLSAAEADARLAAQLPLDDKARRADVVVRNDGDPSHLSEQAARLVDDLRRGAVRRLPNAPPARY